MKWVYLVLWAALAWREVPSLWREKRRRELVLWLSLAGVGLFLGIWLFWLGTDWRLAEALTT